MRRILPPVYFFIAVGAMFALHFLIPLISLPDFPWHYIGLFLMLIGGGIAISSIVKFILEKTPIKPFEKSTQLVTGGFYKYSRNPMYLGLVLLLIGLNICLGTISPIFPIIIFVWILQTQFIRLEEKMLEETFGKEYLNYKNKIRRWI